MKRSGAEWLELTKARFLRNVLKHKVCTIRELEARISESGPGNMRPEPALITNVKNILVDEDTYPIEEKTYTAKGFELKTYGHTSHDSIQLSEAHTFKGELHQRYMAYTLDRKKRPRQDWRAYHR